ncbi:hypothetical protein ACOMHN_031024 [Nucella lapillus]
MAQHNFSSEEHSASPTTKQTGNDEGVVNIGGVLERWRTIGCTKGLSADTEIASFLLQCYEDVSSRRRYGDACCVHCHSPLTLCCLRCSPLSPLAHPLPSTTVPLTTTTTTHPSLPQAYNEEEEAEDVTVGDRLLEAEETATGAKDTEIRREIKISACLSSFSSPQICVGEKVTERTVQDDERILEDVAEERVQDSTTGISEQDDLERSGPVAGLGVEESAPEVLKCLVCCESFTEPDLLTVHMHTHTGGSTCGCDLSAPSFLQTEVLEQQKLSNAHQHQCTQVKHFAESSLASVQEPLSKKKVSSTVTEKYDRNSLELSAKPYQCPQCPSTFRSSSNLQAHLRTHSGHTPYLCPQCGRGFKEITHLKRHLVSHSGEKPYRCQLCDKAYVHATSLKEHTLSHSPTPKTWVCHHCGKAFLNSKRLNIHLKTHDKPGTRPENTAPRRYVCQICNVAYQQASSLSRHKKLHKDGASTLACLECGQTFRDKYELKKHSTVHGRNTAHLKKHRIVHREGTPFQCKLCSKKFRDGSSHQQHLLSHCTMKTSRRTEVRKAFANSETFQRHRQTQSHVKAHACPQCSQTFFTPWTLRLHLQHHSVSNSHSQEKSHVCAQCGATYIRAHSLVRHLRLHEGNQGQNNAPYRCTLCDRVFGDSSHLKRHLLSHSGEKPFVCASCGRAYADSHTLKDHMQVHSGVCSFVCEVCGKAFFSAKRLKEHARSHSEQRPFQCTECSASYKHLSGLVSHRRVHSGLRPFSCGECGKTFKDYTCYKRHQLTHSQHRPHACQQCGKAYKDVKNLRHHMVQLHGSAS